MRFSLRIALPILAAILFGVLSFAATRQSHVIDWGGGDSSDFEGDSRFPSDIGTPADTLLLAFYLPALIALLPLLPLSYWINSELVLRAAWCLSAIGQWFLIGWYFDIRRGLLPAGKPSDRTWLNRMLFRGPMILGSFVGASGLFDVVSGYHGSWGLVRPVGFIFWGIVLVVGALRWRSSLSESDWQSGPLRIWG